MFKKLSLVILYYMRILNEIRACTLCSDVLPLGPRPVIQMSRHSSLLIIGQAPGLTVHKTGKPWNDASGLRLRSWLNMDEQMFYDAKKVAIVPLGFCYPGRGKSGDNPPRPECRARWLDTVLCYLPNVKIILLVGHHAATHFLGNIPFSDLIKANAAQDSHFIVLPHPSPRNNIWLSKNQWFEKESLPSIRKKLLRTEHLT